MNPNMTFGSMPVVGVIFNAPPYISGGPTYALDPAATCTTNGSDFGDCGSGAAAGQVKARYYTACNCGWQVAGFSCPANTASIPVDGFDFTNYNGWNGVYPTSYTYFSFPLGMQKVTYTIKTLCVVPQ
jgi:hypothetical protein